MINAGGMTMSVQADWDNEAKTVIRIAYVGDWVWREHHDAMTAMADLAATVPHRFDVIVDVSESGPLPAGALGNLGATIRSVAENCSRRAVLINNSRFVRQLMDTLLKVQGVLLSNQTYLFAETLAEARELLASQPLEDKA
jgi:hypothetical protein